MKRKVALAIMLTMLQIGMLTLAFGIPLALVDVNVTTGLTHNAARHTTDAEKASFSTRLYDEALDFISAKKRCNFAKADNDSMEMIIGVSNEKPDSCEKLSRLITESQGALVNKVSMNGETVAVVADIPDSLAFTFAEKVRGSGLSRYIEPNLMFQASFVPNDPYWSQQWGPIKIEADYAWNTTTGNPSVLVAVVDTGVDRKHADLAANYVDMGYDWVNKDPDPMDDNGHGTHCAGIVAAALNNGLGIAGLAQVRIMTEKGLDSWGSGDEDDLAKAIIHATDEGADIISCSWGSYLPSALIHEAIKYAYEREVLVIAAAGNDNTNRRSYPAAYDEVIAVSATDQDDNPAGFSNFGEWIELAAPGVNIYSTILNNSYASKGGTSMSCPHVAAVAALIWSKFPNASRDWVRLWLHYTADDLGDAGFDTRYGYGRINARRAVEEVPPDYDVVISSWKCALYVEPRSQDDVATTVMNFGTKNLTDIIVQLLINGSVVDSATIDSLATCKSVTVNCSWTPTMRGRYNVTSYVVPVQYETRIEDNALSSYVFVGIKTLEVPAQYPTIQEAVDAAVSGFTILVRAGTYYENVVVDKTLSLIGENRNTTIIDANGTGTAVSVWASDVNVINFTVRNSGTDWFDSGILLYYSNGVTICNNTMTHNNFGVYIACSFNCTLVNNNASGNTHFGFTGELTFNCTFSENIVTNNFEGIDLYFCPNSTLYKNDAVNNVFGVILVACPNSTLNGNKAANSIWGLYLRYCPNSRLRNNNMTGKGWREIFNFDVWGWELSDFILDIDTSNTVNGKPVYYWVNRRDQAVPSDAGFVGLVNSTNIIVRDLNLSHNGVGILLAYTNNSLVTNNTLVKNEYAVQLSHSWRNLLYGNNLIENRAGISLYASSKNSLYENNVTNVFRLWGILLNAQSNNNSVYGNNIRDIFDQGIMIWHESNNNSISANNITNTDSFAFTVGDYSSNNSIHSNNAVNSFITFHLCYNASNNMIFHNNFINYTYGPQVNAPVNAWDDDYPSGGNYWSNYKGVDFYKGPYQNESGSDGICDTPYVFDKNNRDRYPLMKPWIPPDTTSPVTTISLSGVLGDNGWFTSDVKATLTADDASGVEKTEYSFDKVIWTNYTAPFTITAEGNITVYYKSTDKAGNVETVKTEAIKIDKTVPSANAGVDQAVAEDTLLTFNGSASFDNIGIVSYVWTFIDVTLKNLPGVNPTYTFTTPSTYALTLNVTDAAGNWNTDDVVITVLDVTAPLADPGPDQTVDEDTLITLEGWRSTDNIGTTSWTWTFVDVTPQTLTGENVTYTFITPGVYTITLNVTDAAGNWATETMVITVLDITKPVANAGQDRTVDVGAPITFNAGDSTDNVGIISYEWNFGDDATGTGQTTSHTYANPGTYTVTLTVKDAAGNSATHQITVTVRSVEEPPPPPPPTPQPSPPPSPPPQPPAEITFPLWIAGLALVFTGIVVAAVFLWRRQK